MINIEKETNQPTEQETQALVKEIYEYAAQLLFEEEKGAYQVKAALIAKGLDEKSAKVVIDNLEKQRSEAYKKKGQSDMLYGALWCIGGTIATIANIGFIFWGAILFGGIQFFRGLYYATK